MLELASNQTLRGLTVQGPGKGRASFRIIASILGGTPPQQTIKDHRIDTINRGFKAQKISLSDARAQMDALREKIRSELTAPYKAAVRLQLDNVHERIFTAYWDHYQANLSQAIRNPATTIYDIRRALREVRSVNLHTAKLNELRHAISGVKGSMRTKVVDRLNSVLEFLESEVRLPREPYIPTHAVKYIHVEELDSLTSALRDSYGEKHIYSGDLIKTMIEVLVCTGVRFGEMFMLNKNSIHSVRYILVNSQWARREDEVTKVKWIEKGAPRKNCRTRPSYSAMILKRGMEPLQKWMRYLADPHNTAALEHLRLSRLLYDAVVEASQSAFPGDPIKQIHVHSLRACYAIHLLERGMDIGQAATYIGDSDRVVRQHYSRWVITERMKTRDLALIDD